jgi:hypothetical protein
MNKLLSIGMISLSWIIGLVAVFSFDQVYQPVDQQVSIHANFDFSQDFEIEISSTNLSVEIPSFKIDWQLFGKLNSDWETFSRTLITELSLQEYLKRTSILFDVKSLFLHFFYPW